MKKSLMLVAGLILAGCYFVTENHCSYEKVTLNEVKNITGGACYVEDANAPAKVVCNFLTGCGNLTIHPNVEYSSGYSSSSIPCSTGASCNYTGVSATSCSGS
jgi:hypothetical protein